VDTTGSWTKSIGIDATSLAARDGGRRHLAGMIVLLQHNDEAMCCNQTRN